jgi:antitoxin FitA
VATIQIRNVPEHVHRIYRARAAAAGMSLQEYVLAELVNNVASRSPAEIIAEVERGLTSEGVEVERELTAEGAEVEREMAAEGEERYFDRSAQEIADIIRGDRESH